MKLFIPACGDRLRLTAPWTFTLVFEYRNIKFAQNLGLLDPKLKTWGVYEDPPPGERYSRTYKRAEATVPTGTILECDRIYIRQYNKGRVSLENDYDSVTWRINKIPGKAGRGRPSGRFWVKLPDCYSIEYQLDVDSLYRDRVKLVKEVLES